VNRALVPALALVAACGGSSSSGPTGTTGPRPPSGEEDWKGYLGQLAGEPCNWIPGSTFLACIEPGGDEQTTLIGWEPNNRRYVAWRIGRDGKVAVLPGTASNAGWQFESPDGSITFTRDGKGWSATGLAAATIVQTPDPKADQAGTPSPPWSTEDWRGGLEGFVGDWAFSGVEGGAPTNSQISCKWINAATFVACKHSNHNDSFVLIGWEPQSSRYALYRFTPAGVEVMIATRDNKNWTFSGAAHRAVYVHETGIRRKYTELELRGATWEMVADGSLETGIE